jgi:hypothetical protein
MFVFYFILFAFFFFSLLGRMICLYQVPTDLNECTYSVSSPALAFTDIILLFVLDSLVSFSLL